MRETVVKKSERKIVERQTEGKRGRNTGERKKPTVEEDEKQRRRKVFGEKKAGLARCFHQIL